MKKTTIVILFVAMVSILVLAFAQGESSVLQHIIGEPVPKAPDFETTFINGDIIKIEALSEGSVILTVKTEDSELKIIVNEETYIGNYAKSPAKQISYLKEKMNVDINYYERDKKLVASSVNVLE